MIRISGLFLCSGLLLCSCISIKSRLILSGGADEVIKNAILDFSNTTRLYKKEKVFYVSLKDTIYRMTLEKEDSATYAWLPEKPYDGLLTVSISANRSRLPFASDIKVGSKGNLPSRFVEQDDKLFFWWDNEHPLSLETLNVLKKYNLLQYGKTIPDFVTDDVLKGVHYYFCRDDIANYKKVVTNKGLGYYEPPVLNCK